MSLGDIRKPMGNDPPLVQFRFFFKLPQDAYFALYQLEFLYDLDFDWYEVRVSLGQETVGYVHGYANKGWDPQVNNIWVAEKFRRRGIASVMLSRVEDYFGHSPLPATRIEDNDAAKAFWKKRFDRSSFRAPADHATSES
jgi:ribosomal protein S18 acetylase RimI-like enzyme